MNRIIKEEDNCDIEEAVRTLVIKLVKSGVVDKQSLINLLYDTSEDIK